MISIVIAVKNAVDSIGATLASINAQIDIDFEVLIYDCLSDDGTSEIILQHIHDKNETHYHFRESDRGLYDAWNKGIQRAKGRYIFFLNADDTICAKNTLSTLEKTAVEDDLVCVGGQTVMINKFGKTRRAGENSSTFGLSYTMKHVTPASIFLVDALKEINGFSLDYNISSDYDMMIRLYKKFEKRIKVARVDVVNFSLDGMSNTREKEGFRQVRDIIYRQFGILGLLNRRLYESVLMGKRLLINTMLLVK